MIHLHPQDLHIHTVFSSTDGSIVPEQTITAVSLYRHAEIIGISDHLECLSADKSVERYMSEVREAGFLPGVEVNGAEWVEMALEMEFLYFIYHCRDKTADYRGAVKLLESGKPVIIAHPHALETNLDKVPSSCHIEINNRYVWRTDWLKKREEQLDRVENEMKTRFPSEQEYLGIIGRIRLDDKFHLDSIARGSLRMPRLAFLGEEIKRQTYVDGESPFMWRWNKKAWGIRNRIAKIKRQQQSDLASSF